MHKTHSISKKWDKCNHLHKWWCDWQLGLDIRAESAVELFTETGHKGLKNRSVLLNAQLCDSVWFSPAPPIQRFCHAGTLRERTMSRHSRRAAAGPSGVAPLLSWGPAWHFYSTPRAAGQGGKRCDSALAPPVPNTSAYCVAGMGLPALVGVILIWLQPLD